MFGFTLPKVKERGIKNFVLEVLQQNDAAIKAYSKTGFEIVRSFECFIAQTSRLKPVVRDLPDIGILSVDKGVLSQAAAFSDWKPSWENSISSLLRIPDDLTVLGAFYQEKLVGILAYYPLIRWINLLAVDSSFRNRGIASFLIHELLLSLEGKTSEIKAINVDSSDQALQGLLVKTGFEKVTSQYEMCLKL
jgi:ribosomal protein S18 acetylase RimI-like enzyme